MGLAYLLEFIWLHFSQPIISRCMTWDNFYLRKFALAWGPLIVLLREFDTSTCQNVEPIVGIRQEPWLDTASLHTFSVDLDVCTSLFILLLLPGNTGVITTVLWHTACRSEPANTGWTIALWCGTAGTFCLHRDQSCCQHNIPQGRASVGRRADRLG